MYCVHDNVARVAGRSTMFLAKIPDDDQSGLILLNAMVKAKIFLHEKFR